MKQLLILFFFAFVGSTFAQQPQLLRIPQGSGYTFLNVDHVKRVDSIGLNQVRVRTTQNTHYTVDEGFSDFMNRSGHCKLLKIETQRGKTLAISYASIDRINHLSDSLGVIQLKNSHSVYNVVNMAEVKDSILYAQCGINTIISSNAYSVDSVSIVFDSSYGGYDYYRVVVRVVGVEANQVGSVNLIYEEPFDGGAPLEVETNCTGIGGGYFEGFVSFDEASTGDVIGFAYLGLTDMIGSNGDPLGTQQEFEIYPEN